MSTLPKTLSGMSLSMPAPVERSTIMINTSNFVTGSGNRYVYNLPTPFHARGANISVQSVSIYNSFFNIKSAYANNTFSINWLGTTQSFTIPDGYYDYTGLCSILYNAFLQKGWYVVSNTSSQYVYFADFQINSAQYASQLDIFPIPTSAQAATNGYSLPPSPTWTWPSVATYPQITLCAGLQTLLGLNKQSVFPTATTPSTGNLSFLSTTYPEISQVTSIIVCCNLVKSQFSNVPTILYQLPINVDYSEMISLSQATEQRTSIVDGDYTQIVITLLDQNYNALALNDPEFVISLVVEQPLI